MVTASEVTQRNRVLKRKNIIVDPGIGFGKSLNQNLKIISNINLFHSLGCPILVGLSRKGFIGKIIGQKEPKKRVLSSVILAFELIKKGVHIINDINGCLLYTSPSPRDS